MDAVECVTRSLPGAARFSTRGLRRTGKEEASELWKEFIAGQWAIVEHADEGGLRRLVLARRPPHARAWSTLSRREQEVVALAATGKSRKAIASDLRMCLSSVAMKLRSAALKVDASSRAELVSAYRVAAHESRGAS